MTTRDYIAIANKYIDDVIKGRIKACQQVRQACIRQVEDLKRKKFEFIFDENKACRVCKFIELLHHVKGPLAGQAIVLEPWQVFILTTVFGWVDKLGHRRFQRVYVEVPRGNGKSTLCSGIALYMLCADGEKGADIYSFATTRDQAGIVFGDAQAMARGNPQLQEAFGLTVLAHSMVVLGTNSKMQAKSSDANKLDGLNTHLGIIDELHAHKTREVYDVVETSIGKRLQPLMWCITTAGFVLDGICMEVRRYISKVLSGAITGGDAWFGIIYTIDDGDDWRTEEAVQKANPNWGVSVQPKAILATLSQALTDPAKENNYKTKHLCVWCNADSAFLQMNRWRKCYRPDVELSDFEGMPCIYGLDLAAKVDLTALVRLFWRLEGDEVHYYVFPEFWLPEERVNSAQCSQYAGWVKQDLIHATEGAITSFEDIQQYILNDVSRFDVLAIAFDPWQAMQLASNLRNEGLSMIEIRPTVANFSEPMKQMQALCYAKRLHTDGNPVLEWNASNLVAHTDAKDNVYPRKENGEYKIDGVVATIMALKMAQMLDVENQYIDAVSDDIEDDLVL